TYASPPNALFDLSTSFALKNKHLIWQAWLLTSAIHLTLLPMRRRYTTTVEYPIELSKKEDRGATLTIPADITLQGAIGTVYGIAVLTLATRTIIRIHTRRRLYIDDAFLLFSFLCLTCATGLVFTFLRNMFISEASRVDPDAVITLEDLVKLTNSMAIVDTFLALAWTTTFCVKFSFLALFRLLIHRVSGPITIYYWCVVGFTTITWAFIVSESFILCPYFGLETIRCLPEPPRTLSLSLTTVITILDISTDVMIISIACLILRKIRIKPSQKFGIGAFLCLSVAMILAATTRAAGYRLNGVLDLTWEIFWQYTEAGIAVIMGSLTAFRTLFVQGTLKVSHEKKPSYSIRQRLLRKINKSGFEDGEQGHLPAIPSATLTGLRTFIHGNNRSTLTTTAMRAEGDQDGIRRSAQTPADNKIHVMGKFEVYSTRASSWTADETV
ncbi:hypothetical protein MMC30_009442, partial [Trapelia coarctata]|nr:hypothetical protein [Trapelia coarctata]